MAETCIGLWGSLTLRREAGRWIVSFSFRVCETTVVTRCECSREGQTYDLHLGGLLWGDLVKCPLCAECVAQVVISPFYRTR